MEGEEREATIDDPIFIQPLRIRRIHVVGNNRTHRSVIENEMLQAKAGRTVREVSAGVMEALQSLKEFDCFESVEVYCDVAGKPKHQPGDPMEFTDVTVTVKEKNRVQLKAETYVEGSGAQGGLETALTLNNTIGYAEKVNAAISYGTKSSASGRLQFLKPKFRGSPFMLDLTAIHSTTSQAIFSSYDEKVQRLSATLKNNSFDFGMSTAWRDIIPIRNPENEFGYAASGLIIAQARPTLKNSIHASYTLDRRNHPYGPTRGTLFQLRSECAGFGGDVSFVKGKVKLQHFLPLFEDVTLGMTFETGMLCPVTWPSLGFDSNDRSDQAKSNAANKLESEAVRCVGSSTSISDRFFLGGPLQCRGFDHKGIGPRTNPKRPGAVNGDALGGDLVWSLGYSLYLPFPHTLLNSAGARCHIFANAGNLCAWETSFKTLIKGVRASTGFGVVFPTAIGRIEANYSFVMRANSRDKQKRFQLGLGLDFL